IYTPEIRAEIGARTRGNTYPEMGERNRSGGNPAARGLWVDHQLYPTVKDAAQALGIHKVTIYHQIQRGNPRYRYEQGTEALGAKLSGSNSSSARAITVDGVHYATVDEAIRLLGIGKTTLYRWIRNATHSIVYDEVFDPERETTTRPIRINGIE